MAKVHRERHWQSSTLRLSLLVCLCAIPADSRIVRISPGAVCGQRLSVVIKRNEPPIQVLQPFHGRTPGTDPADDLLGEKRRAFWVYALLPPILAYAAYEDVARIVHFLLDSQPLDILVRRAALEADVIRPAFNGVVVPVLGTALGTLLAGTINVLRNRQVDIHKHLLTEIGLLRMLRRAIFGAYGSLQHVERRERALGYLSDYACQLRDECQSNSTHSVREGLFDVENGIDRLAQMLHGIDGAAVARESTVAAASETLAELNDHRSKRVTAMLFSFPPLHWIILALLAAGLVTIFLVESDEQVVQYLDSLQLRGFFAAMVAVCSTTTMLVYDLNEPFISGAFTIPPLTGQLDHVCSIFESDLQALKERRHSDRGERQRSTDTTTSMANQDWGTQQTVYFHLLTGKSGSRIRMLGDIVAQMRIRVRRGRRAVDASRIRLQRAKRSLRVGA
mmetsp:Transcript_16515/g.32268  ORF Transcript_16515/g.32268 Transcript_16515/m.32268 type:complete len:450 (+) Transcript_16515:246-1595(+)